MIEIEIIGSRDKIGGLLKATTYSKLRVYGTNQRLKIKLSVDNKSYYLIRKRTEKRNLKIIKISKGGK